MTSPEAQHNLELYKQFFRTSFATVFVKDLQGRYLLVSERFVNALQRPREDILGHTDADLFSAEVAAALRSNDEQVVATGAPALFTEQAMLADGLHTYQTIKFPLLDDTGSATAIGGMALDQTDYQSGP